MSVNKIILLGFTGKDPEIHHLDGGNTVASLTLATSKKFTNKAGEFKDKTAWHNLVVWGKLAEVFEKHVKKGQELYVEGEIDYSSYEKDGQTKYITRINVHTMSFVGAKKEGQTESKPSEGTPNPPEYIPSPDDLPF